MIVAWPPNTVLHHDQLLVNLGTHCLLLSLLFSTTSVVVTVTTVSVHSFHHVALLLPVISVSANTDLVLILDLGLNVVWHYESHDESFCHLHC